MYPCSAVNKIDDSSNLAFTSLVHAPTTASGIPYPSHEKKDHQRVMVDSMFKIIQKLRLFLTAVTPTAVAPTTIIL